MRFLLAFLISFNAYAAVFIFGAGEATNLTPVIGYSTNDQKIVSEETADPSATGYTAGEGSLLMRDNAGVGELWAKLSSGDTDWVQALFLDDEGKIPVSHGSQIVGNKYKEFNHDGLAAYSSTTNFATGNNATFDGGGSLAGTLAITTGALDTTDSHYFQFTQAAGSLNDYFIHKQFAIDNGVTVGYRFRYSYDGSDDDIALKVKCSTSGTVYDLYSLPAASAVTTVVDSFVVPSGCGDFEIGFQVAALNSGKILKWNRFTVNDNPFVYKNLVDRQSAIFQGSPASPTGSTNTKIYHFTNEVSTSGSDIVTIDNSTSLGMSVTANKDCFVSIQFSAPTASGSSTTFGLSKNATGWLNTSITSITASLRLTIAEPSASGFTGSTSFAGFLSAGDVIRPHAGPAPRASSATVHFTVYAEADAPHVVIPAKAGSQYYSISQATNALLSRAAEVEFNEATATIVNDTTYGTFMVPDYSTDPTKWVATNKSNFIVTWSAPPDNANTNIRIYKNGSLFIPSTDVAVAGSMSTVTTTVPMEIGDWISVAAETTINSGTLLATVIIEARPKEVTLLAAIPKARTAYVQERKTSGSGGGSSLTWITRDLNTLTGDTSFISLSSNQITLQAGTYRVVGSTVNYKSDGSVGKLYDITNSADAIMGTVSYDGSTGAGANARSIIRGSLTITSPTVYEVYNISNTARATTGLGLGYYLGSSPYIIFTELEITKLPE